MEVIEVFLIYLATLYWRNEGYKEFIVFTTCENDYNMVSYTINVLGGVVINPYLDIDSALNYLDYMDGSNKIIYNTFNTFTLEKRILQKYQELNLKSRNILIVSCIGDEILAQKNSNLYKNTYILTGYFSNLNTTNNNKLLTKLNLIDEHLFTDSIYSSYIIYI